MKIRWDLLVYPQFQKHLKTLKTFLTLYRFEKVIILFDNVNN